MPYRQRLGGYWTAPMMQCDIEDSGDRQETLAGEQRHGSTVLIISHNGNILRTAFNRPKARRTETFRATLGFFEGFGLEKLCMQNGRDHHLGNPHSPFNRE
jgi:hypothetical protein